MDFTAIKYLGQGSFKVKKRDDWQTFIFTENHRHLPIASANDPLIEPVRRDRSIKISSQLLDQNAAGSGSETWALGLITQIHEPAWYGWTEYDELVHKLELWPI